MLEFPYGIADFYAIRRDRMVYVDRTAHIHDVERLGRTLVFLRPRRFGKSLWLQTLATYYDVRYADEFDEIFGGLAIHRDPTPLRNRFFVLQWNFSNVDPGGSVREIAESLEKHVRDRAKLFARQYASILPDKIEVDGHSSSILTSLLSVVRKTPYRLYLLIDEYDYFVNEVMVGNSGIDPTLFDPYKQLFKSIKAATEGQGLEHVFITGVSPIALNELRDGFNISTDVSLEPELAALCGFREREVCDAFGLVARERGLSGSAIHEALDVMRSWYNGYRFSEDADVLVYNPTGVLYFLDHLQRYGRAPARALAEDPTLDQTKLAFLTRTAAGTGVIERLIERDGEIQIPRLMDTPIGELAVRLSRDPGTVASLLYCMGLLTLTDLPGHLRIPNLVANRLLLDRLPEVVS